MGLFGGNPFKSVSHALSNAVTNIGQSTGVDQLVRDIPGSKKQWEQGGRIAAAIPTGGLSLARNRDQALRIAGTEAALLGGAYGFGVGGFGPGAATGVGAGATEAGSAAAGAADYTSPAWIAANSSTAPGIGAEITGAAPASMSTVPGISAEILGGAGEGAAATGATSALAGGSGTVGETFANTATGAGATGLGGSTAPASVSGAVAPNAIGSSAQLTAGGGPLGDVAAGVGDTNSSTGFIADKVDPVASNVAKSSTLGTIGKFAAKYGLPIAALSTQLLRKPGIPQEGNLNKQYNTQEAQGQADIASARAGTVSPAQQAQVDKFKTDSMSSIKQYMANSGQGMDSTSFIEMKGKVDQAAIAMQQGFVDQLFSQGMQELGLADSAQEQLIQLRMQREQQTSDALNNFMLSLGLMGGFS